MPEKAKKEPKAVKSEGERFSENIKKITKTKPPGSKTPVKEMLQKEFQRLHPKTGERVCILGFTATKELAPFNDTNVEMWGCNELYAHTKRMDVVFELHDRKEWGEDCGSNYKMQHIENLKNFNKPVYMAEKYPDVPNSFAYPWKEIFGFVPYGDYLTNSISEMLALAIYMEYKEIGLFGVEMAHHTEYPTQRPSVEYWLGIIAGMYKIKGWPRLILPRQCQLLKSYYIYGLDNEDKWIQAFNEQKEHFMQQRIHYENEELKGRDLKNQYIGSVAALDHLAMVRLNNRDNRQNG